MTSLVAACGPSRSASVVTPKPAVVSPPSASVAAPAEAFAVLSADTPQVTARGTSFVAPKGWKVTVHGDATLMELPEAGSWVVVKDVTAKDADAAIEATWAAYGAPRFKLRKASNRSNREGWRDTRQYYYDASPAEREVQAIARRSSDELWTVVLEDISVAVVAERAAQRKQIHATLLPKGYERESFARRPARALGSSELDELRRFVTMAQRELGIPGVSLGVVQDGRVVFSGGFGVRELGKPAPVDASTLFMVASQSKPLTTLMLAKLVEEGKLSWETPVVDLYPSFKLRAAEATASLRFQDLVCACTGTPRKDWSILEFRSSTPQRKLEELAAFTPIGKPGDAFRYSDLLVAAAGFVGGHVAYPQLELGAAYDKAVQTRVLGPLGMTATTLDHYRALRHPNHATAHSPDRNGKPAPAMMVQNELLIAQRPAGGVWSNVPDMLKYVQLELARGKLPDGKSYIAEGPLLARRVPHVTVDESSSYGLGLFLERRYGVPVVWHGGDVVGYHGATLWLPEHGVGAVILMNGDPGWALYRAFLRKLLELLFDGRPEADASISKTAEVFHGSLAETHGALSLPADASDAAKLAPRYANDELGELVVRRDGASVIFDFGEWKSEVGSRRGPDGGASFRAVDAGYVAFELELMAGVDADGKRTLRVRDEPYEYTFTEK